VPSLARTNRRLGCSSTSRRRPRPERPAQRPLRPASRTATVAALRAASWLTTPEAQQRSLLTTRQCSQAQLPARELLPTSPKSPRRGRGRRRKGRKGGGGRGQAAASGRGERPPRRPRPRRRGRRSGAVGEHREAIAHRRRGHSRSHRRTSWPKSRCRHAVAAARAATSTPPGYRLARLGARDAATPNVPPAEAEELSRTRSGARG